MTYIEFFDKTCIENICASLTNPPERVVFIGDGMKVLKHQAEKCKEFMSLRGAEVEFVCKSVNKNSIQSVVEVLSSIIETYDDCIFDLTGGEDVLLVAAGIVFERYKDKNIQMHRFNIRNNTIHDCDLDGKTILESEMPQLTIEENIQLYGGVVVYEEVKPNATPTWNFEGDLIDDIDLMWDICKRNVRSWNTQMGVFKFAEILGASEDDPLTTVASIQTLTEELEDIGAQYVFKREIINPLYHAGLIDAHEYEDTFSITYKNEQVKRCLIKAGQILEMKIYISALRTREKNDSYTYNDVMNGVYIDWDGDVHTEQDSHDIQNEIDVMMMRGMIPVFVSCKNGHVDMEELYKLNTVATRFGGKYAKKVLVATALGKNNHAERLRERAKAMGIKLVEGIQDMDDAELQKTIRTFWNS